MNPKIKNLIQTFSKHKIDALLITKDENITYLTGFGASESWLLITKTKSYYITDFRYVLEATKGLQGSGVVLKQYTKSIADTLFDLAKEQNVNIIGFDESQVTVALHKRLKKMCPSGMALSEANGLVESFREIKDIKEVVNIQKALRIHAEALKYLKRIIKVGATERDVFLKLEAFVKARDVGFSFNPIIASGANSCFPHASVTKRVIRANEPVLVDMGIDYKGYKSDLTRMFFLGKMSQSVLEVNALVKEAQLRAIQKVKAGVKISEVDHAARGFLAEHDLAKYFGHSLGHGVGLEIHEDPRISGNNGGVLKEGMVITMEPAVYLPNKFGIRIEDMVVVTKKGCKVLSDNID